MKQDIEERALRTGEWVAEHRATVRAAAKEFGVSKSTVHKDGGVIIRIEGQMFEMGWFQRMHLRTANYFEPFCQRL